MSNQIMENIMTKGPLRKAQDEIFVQFLLCAFSLFGLVGGAFAEASIPFSGIAFTSEKSVARVSLPYSFKSIGDLEASPSKFVQRLNASANGLVLKNGNLLSSTQLNNISLGQSMVMALAIQNERMKAVPLSAPEHQLTFDLDAQILIFNFREKAIVAAYPLRLTLLTVLDQEPLASDREALAKVMFFGDPDKNIFEDIPNSYLIYNFIETIKNITIKPAWRSQIRIMNIDFSNQANKILLKYEKDQDYFRQLAASSLSSSMSTKLDIPVLPYVKSDAIQNSMTLRFSNTNLMNLKIPEANFQINLTVRGFGHRQLRSTERTKVISFISGVQVTVIDNDFNDIKMDTKFQSGNLRKLSTTMEIDHWAEYEISFLSLLDQVVSQFQKPEKKWVKEHTAGNKSSKDVVKELKRVRDKVIDQIKG